MKLACSDDLNPHAEDSAAMYRIEISPGEETVLRTIEELATAIRNGLVTSRSRVYHNASQKWLPIEFHPHYKKALALPERPKSAPVTTALPSAVPSFATKREAAPAPDPLPAPVPPKPEPVAEAPVKPRATARLSVPLPAAAENLPFIEVEMPPREPAAPLPSPAPAPRLALGPDAFPSLARPSSYLPPELAQEPVKSNRPAEPAREPVRYTFLAEPAHETVKAYHPAEPASPMPVASRRASGGRPVLVGVAALALVVVGYFFMTSRPSSQVAAESVPPAGEQKQASGAPVDEEESLPPEDTDIPVPQPSAINSAPPRSGPASQAWSSSAGATAPLLPTGPARQPTGTSEAAIVSAPAIAPPPAHVDLTVPKLPGTDSLAAKTQRDTAAIKRILKAVGAQ